MLKKFVLSLLLLTAVAITHGFNEAGAGPANVNVHINGYLPAPPGVTVQIDGGRPYYVERNRRIYIDREKPAKHYKQYKKKKKHHDDHGNKYGHYK